MIDFLYNIPIPILALLLGIVCLICTSLGSSLVFCCKNLNQKIIAVVLSFSAGIMISASFFSLIIPAFELCENDFLKEIFLVIDGLVLGGIFLIVSGRFFEKNLNKNRIISKQKRTFLLASSITIHNIPEGMSIGVALGTAMIAGDTSLILPAIMLAVGIAIQNIPEGASVSLPLKASGVSTKKSFFIGCLGGVVEPIFAVLACLFSMQIASALPLFLAFAGSVMLIVSLSELIPDATIVNKTYSIIFFLLGFILMTFLEIII